MPLPDGRRLRAEPAESTVADRDTQLVADVRTGPRPQDEAMPYKDHAPGPNADGLAADPAIASARAEALAGEAL
jgi:hypothetical protein